MNLYWPKRSMFRSREWRHKRAHDKLVRAEAAAKAVVQISHGGCLDGAGSVVMTMRHYGADQVGVAYVHPGDMPRVLEHFAQHEANGRVMEITDLSINSDKLDAVVVACRRLKEKGWKIAWRDHHHKQWEGVDLTGLKAVVDTLEISPNEESGASMQQKALLPKDKFAAKLAKVHRDRDLWLNETTEGETLEFAMSQLGADDYVAHMVPRQDGEVVDDFIQAAADKHQREVNAAGAKILKNTRLWTASTGEQVAVVFGWLPKNVGLHELLQEGETQVAINVRPNGFMSLRSNKGADVCQMVASQFDGGGHVNASGGSLGLKGAAFWAYILRRGKVAQVTTIAEAAVVALETR